MAVTKALQRLPHALEHGIIKPCTVCHTERIQLMGNREHYMKILYCQGILHPVLYPKGLLCCLAFRTMAVAATVVTYPFPVATIASIFVPAKGRSPTLLQRIKGSNDKTIGLIFFNILFCETTYDLC
jgi:hypothetical protein